MVVARAGVAAPADAAASARDVRQLVSGTGTSVVMPSEPNRHVGGTGTGSLRWAASQVTGGEVIRFAPEIAGQTITLSAPVVLANYATIEGFTREQCDEAGIVMIPLTVTLDGAGYLEGVDDAGRATSKDQLIEDAFARESTSATGLPGGIAIPHCRSPYVDTATIGFARLVPGVDFGAPDGPADRVLVFFAGHGELNPADKRTYLVPRDFDRSRAATRFLAESSPIRSSPASVSASRSYRSARSATGSTSTTTRSSSPAPTAPARSSSGSRCCTRPTPARWPTPRRSGG